MKISDEFYNSINVYYSKYNIIVDVENYETDNYEKVLLNEKQVDELIVNLYKIKEKFNAIKW